MAIRSTATRAARSGRDVQPPKLNVAGSNSVAPFDVVATRLAESLLAAHARALDVSPATSSWRVDRASERALAFSDEHGHVEEATELQLDELSARLASEASPPRCSPESRSPPASR